MKNVKRPEGELPGKIGNVLAQISLSMSERLFEIKYYGDVSDLGNEIGYVVGNVLKDMSEQETTDFIHGIKHGISLTNGTH
jgi:hypothetical protein